MPGQLEPSIRASVLRPLVSVLEHVLGDPEALLRRYGLTQARLQDPYGLVPLRNYVALFEAAAEAAEDPLLGLHLGQGIQPELLGPVGLVFNAAPNLRQGFRSLGRFLAAWQEGTRLLLLPEEEGGAVSYRIDDRGIWPRRQDAEFSLAATCGMVRSRLGQRWRAVEVRFEHAPPADPAQHERIFRCPVSFGHPTNAIVVSEADLLQQLVSPDPIVVKVMENHLHDLLDRMNREDTICDRVAFLIASRLGQAPVTVPEIARELGLSARSLQRYLAEKGTSLRALTQAERLRTARTLLETGTLSVEAIARSLGYADASILSRAFRQWQGAPPRRPRGEAARVRSLAS